MFMIANLDAYLIEFEKNAIRRGSVVHWAETAEEANAIIVKIAQENNVKAVTKSKSMVSEEVALNDALEAVGVSVAWNSERDSPVSRAVVDVAREIAAAQRLGTAA